MWISKKIRSRMKRNKFLGAFNWPCVLGRYCLAIFLIPPAPGTNGTDNHSAFLGIPRRVQCAALAVQFRCRYRGLRTNGIGADSRGRERMSLHGFQRVKLGAERITLALHLHRRRRSVVIATCIGVRLEWRHVE